LTCFILPPCEKFTGRSVGSVPRPQTVRILAKNSQLGPQARKYTFPTRGALVALVLPHSANLCQLPPGRTR